MFIQRLKELREKKDVSQSKLADYMGVSQQAIAKWETDKATPDPDALLKLAEYFNVSVDYLLGKADTSGIAGKVLSSSDALEEKDFVVWFKGRLLAAQDAAERILGDVAKPARVQYENFDILPREKQMEILQKACSEIIKTSDGKYKLVLSEIKPEITEFIQKNKQSTK